MKNIVAACCLMAAFPAFSQTTGNVSTQTTTFQVPCAGLSAPPDERNDWHPSLIVSEADHIDEEAGQRTKDSLAAIYRNRPHHVAATTQRSAAAPGAPVVGATFAGNGFGNSTPADNEIAVANNGHLVSVQNSNIYRYRTADNTSAGLQSLTSFALPLGNSATKYDPKVIYDPEADRFILVCLAGYASGSTHIVVGFSTSDTANGSYNLYQLPGNPFNDTLWSDYPMIAVNHNELFLTVNLLHDNQSWQLGFVQTVIWQMNKWDGYAGDTLRSQLHSGIQYNGRPIRNICPVEGGANTFNGPDMYFLSERNLDAMNDSVFLVHITDTANAAGQQLTVMPLVSNTSYFMPPNAREPGNVGNLATNDSRILGAFIQNDKIQYVSNTMDTATGLCAIYHGVISNVSASPSLTGYIIGDTSLEYGYPNIAYMGYGTGDNTAIISFLHSDSTTFPGTSAITTDGNGAYSTRTLVKAGYSYYDVLSGDERWGDYSGIQRKYDVGGTCWVNGMYGGSNHTHGTWISQLGISSDVNVPENTAPVTDISVYPNPFAETISISFENEKVQQVRFVLYDATGREVKLLLEDQLPEGKTGFSFSTGPLQPGIYFLRAETKEGNVLFAQKVIKN